MSDALQAVAFDAYGTLFDVHSVASRAEQLFPGQGPALSQVWRERQIAYSRLRSMSDRWKPFGEVTRDALRMACALLRLPLSDEAERSLMNAYSSLSAFPENLPALRGFRELGLPLAILSNGDADMLDVAVASAGMDGLFEHVLSAQAVRRFKTAPEVYGMAPAALGVPAGRILFVSSNGWDACGAAWYGYRSFWINRTGAPAERLDATLAGTGHLLTDALAYARGVV